VTVGLRVRRVGRTLGRFDGRNVGLLEGTLVEGLNVGIFDGFSVGFFVGRSVGSVEGNDVVSVGNSVGNSAVASFCSTVSTANKATINESILLHLNFEFKPNSEIRFNLKNT